MGGEQAAATQIIMHSLEHRPGDGEAVIGAGAAPDFIEDDQAARCRARQDRGGFHHFHHEGTASLRQIIRRADAAVQPVDDADVRGARRHEAAGLRQHGDQRVLPQKGRFSRHVRPRHQPQPGIGRQVAIIGDELAPAGTHRRFDHRVPPGLDMKGASRIDMRPHPVFGRRQFRQPGRHIDPRQRQRGAADRRRFGKDERPQFLQMRGFGGERMVAGLGNRRCQRRQVDTAEAHHAGERLAVDQPRIGAQQRIGELCRDFDMIAEHAIVTDFQRRHPGFAAQPGFERHHRAAPVARGFAQRIEPGIMPRRDRAAGGGIVRRFGDQRAPQRLDKPAMLPDAGQCRGQQRRRHQRRRRQHGLQRQRQRQPVAHLAKITRCPAPHRQPAKRPRHIGHGGQRLAHPAAADTVFGKPADQIKPVGNRCSIGQWCRQVGGEQAPAAGSDSAVDHGLEAAGAAAAGPLRQFKAGAGRGIDRHGAARQFGARRREQRHGAPGGHLDIGEQRASRGDFGRAEMTKTGKGCHAEARLQPGLAARRGEIERRSRGRRCPAIRLPAFGRNQLGRRQPRQFGEQFAPGAGAGGKGTCRQVAPRQPGRAACRIARRHRRQPVRPFGIEQLRLGQRAWRHHPGDGAAHDRFAGAFLGLGRVFHLFGDSDPVAALDQPRQIGIGGMHRHPAHRDRHAGMFAAPGQRDIERGSSSGGIIEEKFVKIAHAEEQQAIGRFVLQRQILCNHRRGGGKCRERGSGSRIRGHPHLLALNTPVGKQSVRRFHA